MKRLVTYVFFIYMHSHVYADVRVVEDKDRGRTYPMKKRNLEMCELSTKRKNLRRKCSYFEVVLDGEERKK